MRINFYQIFLKQRMLICALAILTILELIIFVPILYHQMWEGSDFPEHIKFALNMVEQKTIAVPQFLYHFLVIGQYILLKNFVVLGSHLICGIFWYIVQLTSSPISKWW